MGRLLGDEAANADAIKDVVEGVADSARGGEARLRILSSRLAEGGNGCRSGAGAPFATEPFARGGLGAILISSKGLALRLGGG